MSKTFESIGIFVVSVVLATLLLAGPVYLLWNWLMPELFGLPTLTFWQALGLLALTNCLFPRGSSSSK